MSDPYPRFNFLVRWQGTYVSGIFHVGPIGWVATRGEGDTSLLSSVGSVLTGGIFGDDDPAVAYSPVQLQRARTQDDFFERWARTVSDPDADGSSGDRERNIEIQLLDEAGTPVIAFILRGCTPIEYGALGPLDANADGIAVETLTLSYRSFERDLNLR
jgi:hypothetical protein